MWPARTARQLRPLRRIHPLPAQGQGGGAAVEGHTHANKADLDKLGVTQDGYVTVTDKAENEGGAVTAKARAGEADEAAHAASAAALDADSPTREDFLSAKDDDTAEGNITFAKDIDVKGGEKVGGDMSVAGSANIGTDGKSTKLSVSGDASVSGTTTTHNLTVTGKATFFELEIQKATAAGGLQIYSAGAGKADAVGAGRVHAEVSSGGTVTETAVSSTNPANAYVLYQLATDESGECGAAHGTAE